MFTHVHPIFRKYDKINVESKKTEVNMRRKKVNMRKSPMFTFLLKDDSFSIFRGYPGGESGIPAFWIRPHCV